jgi:hypothetical protein
MARLSPPPGSLGGIGRRDPRRRGRETGADQSAEQSDGEAFGFQLRFGAAVRAAGQHFERADVFAVRPGICAVTSLRLGALPWRAASPIYSIGVAQEPRQSGEVDRNSPGFVLGRAPRVTWGGRQAGGDTPILNRRAVFAPTLKESHRR